MWNKFAAKNVISLLFMTNKNLFNRRNQAKNPVKTTPAIKYVILQVVIVRLDLFSRINLLPAWGDNNRSPSELRGNELGNGVCLGCEARNCVPKLVVQRKKDWWILVVVPKKTDEKNLKT